MLARQGEMDSVAHCGTMACMSDPPCPDANDHFPVMLDPVIELLAPAPGQVVLDGTAGRGGHGRAIVERLGADGHYIALDVDPVNVAHCRAVFADAEPRVTVVNANFNAARRVLDALGIERVDGLLADLGFATPQMADPTRGMSFTADGPLDMRLDPTLENTAADLIARLSEKDLADLIYQYGEERLSRRIARKIVECRRTQPITTTRALADLCVRAYGPSRGRHRIHPATRTFQALRIAVNDELGALQQLLEAIDTLAAPNGRIVVISFHSLEDRLVKHTFRRYAQEGRGEVLTKKPRVPGDMERAANPPSRSAKCRALRWGD